MSEIGARERCPRDVILWVRVLFWIVNGDSVDVTFCSSTCVIAISCKMCSLFSQGKSLDMSLKIEER